MTLNYRVHESPAGLLDTAQALANENGAPVALLSRDGLYRLCDSAPLYEGLITVEHWTAEAVVDPCGHGRCSRSGLIWTCDDCGARFILTGLAAGGVTP